ncbi:MAG: hypothetical protein R3318_00455 [Gammaproteobacteria bacterium]|nr:hypothetical protein [Gammaproteobacteria bacterium]
MAKENLYRRIHDARQIVEQLHNLLHEDALHRLDLYQEYGHDREANKWSPDLYHRCQLVEVLRQKLNEPIH